MPSCNVVVPSTPALIHCAFQFDLIQSEKIEVTENDRIGFCSEEDVTPVSMTIGDHRTHFRSIEDDEFPVVREEYEFEAIPFPAAFSIGVSISDGTEISYLLSLTFVCILTSLSNTYILTEITNTIK